MDQLDEIATLVKEGTIPKVALQVVSLGRDLKSDLLHRLEAQELHGHPAYRRIQQINFWPWSGTIEAVIKDLKEEFILKHWTGCIERAERECALVSELVANRTQKRSLLEKATKLLSRGKKKKGKKLLAAPVEEASSK